MAPVTHASARVAALPARWRTMAAAALLVAIAASPSPATADDVSQETDIFKIARGGQLYDKWWAVMEMDEPTETHPAYPAEGGQKGASTWRCKECHGWDYKGVDGAYGSGSHFTGIKGIRGKVGADPAEIVAILRDATHGYSADLMPDSAAEKLALFVSLGQLDMDQYIDRATKLPRGSAEIGARYYQTVCAICHGFDGKDLNFGDAAKPEYIGTVARANPWETLHKVRNGQPGNPMPALMLLAPQELVDIVTYAQTLPAE